jgi:hypothetical protein
MIAFDLDGNTLKARGNFDIDRRQGNMNYGNDKTLGDKFISEKVNIELDVKARKVEVLSLGPFPPQVDQDDR